MRSLHYPYYIIIIMLINFSCSKEPIYNEPKVEKVKIAEKTLSSGEVLSIWAEEQLHTGYQLIYFRLTDKKQIISHKKIDINLLMDMGTMQHSCPKGPVHYNSANQLYESYAVFTMASTMESKWILEINLNNEQLFIPLDVKQKSNTFPSYQAFKASNGDSYLLVLIDPLFPIMGFNSYSIMVFKQQNMHSYQVEKDLRIQTTPYMLSMNHGSANNEDPIYVNNGFYKGKVNFTMTGDWRLNFVIQKENIVLSDKAYLDVTVLIK